MLRGGPGEALTSLVEHLLLLHRIRDFRRLPSEVKVLAHILLRGRAVAAEGVIVECIVAIVEVSAQTLVCLLKVNAVHGC